MEYDRFQLKDGRMVIFDELKEQDSPKLIEVFNSVIKEGLYFHRNEGPRTSKQQDNGIKTTSKLDFSILPRE